MGKDLQHPEGDAGKINTILALWSKNLSQTLAEKKQSSLLDNPPISLNPHISHKVHTEPQSAPGRMTVVSDPNQFLVIKILISLKVHTAKLIQTFIVNNLVVLCALSALW
jgi:hypothetical protein